MSRTDAIATTPSEPASEPRVAAMRRAAAEFEAVLVGQMLAGMTAGLSSDGPLGGADDPFGSMLRDEYGRLISRKGGIGVADAVLRQLMRAQEVR
ncbi:MAG: rod-binding protein [Geminicoccaceae bacterium]|mgnify:CR=1 FL=1